MNTCKRLLAFAIMLLLIPQTASSTVSLAQKHTKQKHTKQKHTKRQCSEVALVEGLVSYRKGLRLGRPVEFDDNFGISSGRCYPLYVGNRFAAWVNELREAGSKILIRRCTEDTSGIDVESGAKAGRVKDSYEEMTVRRDEKFAFRETQFTLWSEFANPKFCGSTVAYWGTESAPGAIAKVYAILFDADADRLIRKELVGATQIESDSRDFFAPPIWNASGTSALFDTAPMPTSYTGRSKLKRVRLSMR